MPKRARGNWRNWCEFFLSSLGYMVGLGNIWRFPYLCHKNGGGAFLIPYFTFLLTCAVPMLCLEFCCCQFSNLGPGKVWIMCPFFKGIGIGMILVNAIDNICYTVIISWAIYYLGMSFSPTLPWSNCGNSWNTPHHVFDRSDRIDDMGVIRWQLLLCLLAAWAASFFILLKGMKTSGKVMYVAATAPYVMLLILLVRGLFLPGAVDGLAYFIVPQWEKLTEVSVRYVRLRDTFLLSVMDGFTSLFAGMVIFLNLGFMAEQANLKIADVVSEGPGIPFMVYPEALAQLPLPQLWSACFFLLFVTVGLNSQVVHLQTISTAIMDNIPRLRNKHIPVNLMLSLPSFGLGLFCITQGGVYVLQLLDWYTASISVMLGSLLQVLVLAYVYGAERLYGDMELMLGRRPSPFWKICWLLVCPVIISCLWVKNLVNIENVYYGDYTYPSWSIGIGWLIAAVSVTPMPAFMVYALYCGRGSFLQRVRQSIRPSSEWGPDIKELKEDYCRKHQGGATASHAMKSML